MFLARSHPEAQRSVKCKGKACQGYSHCQIFLRSFYCFIIKINKSCLLVLSRWPLFLARDLTCFALPSPSGLVLREEEEQQK